MKFSTRVACLLCVLHGCGHTPSRTTGAEELPTRLPKDLVELLPPEARLVAAVRLSRLMSSSVAMDAFGSLFTDEWADRAELQTGLPPRSIETLIVAEYPGEGLLLLCRARRPMRDVVIAAGMRMNTIEVRSSDPFERRVGFLGRTRWDLVALSDDTILVGKGRVGARVASTLDRVTTHSHDDSPVSECHEMWERHRGKHAMVLVPQHLALPQESGIAALLSRHEAFVVSVDTTESAVLVEGEVRGALPPGSDANFRRLLQSLGNSDMGRALGIDRAAQSLRLQVGPQNARLWLPFDASDLARGVRLLFASDWQALIEDP